MKKEKSAFRRNGDVMVQVWKDKTRANYATIVNKERKDRKTNMEIKNPYAVGQYNKFHCHWVTTQLQLIIIIVNYPQ